MKPYFDIAGNGEVSLHCLTAQQATDIMSALNILADDKLKNLKEKNENPKTAPHEKATLTTEINELNQFIVDLSGSFTPVKKLLAEKIPAPSEEY